MLQSKTEMQIVYFLDIDTNKMTFVEPKPNKHNGSKLAYYIMVRLCMSNMKELLLLVWEKT